MCKHGMRQDTGKKTNKIEEITKNKRSLKFLLLCCAADDKMSPRDLEEVPVGLRWFTHSFHFRGAGGMNVNQTGTSL